MPQDNVDSVSDTNTARSDLTNATVYEDDFVSNGLEMSAAGDEFALAAGTVHYVNSGTYYRAETAPRTGLTAPSSAVTSVYYDFGNETFVYDGSTPSEPFLEVGEVDTTGGNTTVDDTINRNPSVTNRVTSTERVSTDLVPLDPNRDARLHRTRGRRRDLTGTVYGRPSKACVAFQIDGTRESAYTNNDPYLDNNVPVGLAVTTDRVGGSGYLTWGQIDELINDEGWEMMNHTKSHTNFNILNESEMREEIYVAHRELLDKGYEPSQFVYTGGDTGGDTGKGIVAELYDYAFGINEFTFADSTAIAPYDLPRKATESQFNSTADLKSAIDTANSNDVAVHFYTHEIIEGVEGDEGPTETSTGKLTDVIAYAQNQGVDILAPDEALRYCAPQMPFGRGGLTKMRMRPDNGTVRTSLAPDSSWVIRDDAGTNRMTVAENDDWFWSPPATIFFDLESGGAVWFRDSSNNLTHRILESGTWNVEADGRLNIKGEFDLDPKTTPPSSPSNGEMAYADGTNWDPGSGEGFYGYEAGAWTKL